MVNIPPKTLDDAARARWAGQAPLRILVGPYHHRDHWHYMRGAFDDHDCITFGSHGQVDLHANALDDIHGILRRLPPTWSPDLILLWRPEYGSIPRNLQHVDVPVVMLTNDWYVAFSDTVEAARFCNLTVTGTRGERVLSAAGFSNVLNMPMLGFQPGVDGEYQSEIRDIDVFTATNPNFTVHRFRERVINRLLDLPDQVDLRVRANISRREYNKMLGRSKIFINNTVIGEINMKVYEATAAGACLFLEEDHLDVHRYLVPDESVVLYNLDNLNEKILYYLEHEEERAAIAAKGHETMQGRSYRANMNDILAKLKEIGHDQLMKHGREIVNASPQDQRRHYLVHSLNHSYSQIDVLLEEASQLDPESHPNDALLQGVAQYLGIYAKMDEAWSPEELLSSMEPAAEAADASIALQFALATYAKQMGSRPRAQRWVRHCIDRLEAGVPIPFARGDAYLVGRNQKFLMERAAWECIEVGLPPDEALRPILLSVLYGQLAELALQNGELEQGIAALRRASEAYPAAKDTRPLLAKALVCASDLTGAADVLAHHLVEHPLHWKTHPDLFDLCMNGGELTEATRVLLRLQRIAEVFANEEMRQQVRRMARELGEAQAAAAPTKVDLSRPAALGAPRQSLASS